jgi:hypothetical protein
MTIATPEMHKKPGVTYAVNEAGLELPVVDVTHPAFAVEISQGELDRLLEEHRRNMQGMGKLSKLIQPLVLRLMARRSMIMRGIMAAAGGFMSGTDTYLLKLGPDNLGNYASSIDRQIAGSISGLSIRLRLQDISHLLADGLVGPLRADNKSPLHMLNIGGGPAIDSLNALIILHKQQPGLLSGRAVCIHILDLVEAGPRFGSRALAALQAEAAPLHGLDIRFQHVAYDWSNTNVLTELLKSLRDASPVMAVSSEGALFEYGSDEEIAANLRALDEDSPSSTILVGSLTRADATGRLLNSSSSAAIQLRGIEAFSMLIEPTGWRVAERLDRPMSHDICLRKVGEP